VEKNDAKLKKKSKEKGKGHATGDQKDRIITFGIARIQLCRPKPRQKAGLKKSGKARRKGKKAREGGEEGWKSRE